jgi:RNA polymerase sigma-70 factor, ECF subfamily
MEAANGHADATSRPRFDEVYRHHWRGVFGAAYRVLGRVAEADDVAQEVFTRHWREPGHFDARRGELGSYLRLMARSRALDLWRREQAAARARDRLALLSVPDEVPVRERPADVAARASLRPPVVAALRRLPPPQREALVLAYWGGLTADEIARRSGVPLGTAKSRIRMGLDRLRDDGQLAATLAA